MWNMGKYGLFIVIVSATKAGFHPSGTGIGGLVGGAPTLDIELLAGASAGFGASKLLWSEIVDSYCEQQKDIKNLVDPLSNRITNY